MLLEHQSHSAQLWASDGTSDGTGLVFEFPLGILPADEHHPTDLTVAGPNLFFTAVTADHGRELWISDGTPDGTVRLTDLAPGPSDAPLSLLTAWGADLAFIHHRGTPELWLASTDPAVGTRKIVDLPAGAEVYDMAASGSRLYLAASTPELGRELWISDGSAAGTAPIDIFPGPRDSAAGQFVPIDGGLFFAAQTDDGAGVEPWITGGNAFTTRRVADIFKGPVGSLPEEAVRVGQRVYFAATSDTIGRELFYLDLDAVEPSRPPCPANHFCPQDGRFQVALEWRADGESDLAQIVQSGDESALFWFFQPDNWESMVKVLDGCDLNGYFWVFAATSSDVGYTLTVRDLDSGLERVYTNPEGVSAPAIADSKAFANCHG